MDGTRRLMAAALGALAVTATAGAGAAQAAPVVLCIKAGAPVVAAASDGTCASGYTVTKTASETDLAAARTRIKALETLLAGVTRSSTTLRISGVNVRIDNGAGSTTAKNGRGNLILGYNETPGTQTGSHNLLVGRKHTATGAGGLVAGEGNTVSGDFSAAVGSHNVASGLYALVAGSSNTASGHYASVLAGSYNLAAKPFSAVMGGMRNEANAFWSQIAGGCGNVVDYQREYMTALAACTKDPFLGGAPYSRADFGTVLGGHRNLVKGVAAAIAGGGWGEARGRSSSVTGGHGGRAVGESSAVHGGVYNFADGRESAVLGGFSNDAIGEGAIVAGGNDNHATGDNSAILGGSGRTLSTPMGTYPAGP